MESSTSSLRHQGVQALEGGQIDAAIDLLTRAVSADGHDAEAQAFLGLACSRKGLHAHARQALEAAAALEPQNARYRCHLGAALERAGELSDALRAYREALQIDPSLAEAHTRAAALEARAAFAPGAAAEFALPPPTTARAEAPWLAGQYAAAAGGGYSSTGAEAPLVSGASPDPISNPAPSRPARPSGRGPARRRTDKPASREGNRRLIGFLAVYVVVTVGLLGWLVSRWVPGIVREEPSPSPAVQSLLIRAWRAQKSAHPQEAEHLYRQAVEEARLLGDQPGEAMSLAGMGNFLYEQKQPRRALEYLQPALALFRQLGDRRSVANTLNNMGLACSDIRQPQRALEYLRQALAEVREAGDKTLEADIIDSFGMVYEGAGQPQRALPYYQKTLAMARQIGDKQLESLELKNTARMQRRPPPGQRPAVASAGMAPGGAAPLPGGRR